MSEGASFDLNRGLSNPQDIVGKTVVHRPRREIGFPLVFSLVCGLFALGLLAAAFVTGLTLSRAAILVGLELVIGGGLGWLAVVMFIAVVADVRFNRRRYEVRFGLRGVEIGSVDGVEQVALADAAAHPLLRHLPVDSRIWVLNRVRAACQQLAPDAEVRVVLETFALLHLEDEPISHDGHDRPPPRPYYAIILRSGQVNVFPEPLDPEEFDEVRRSGLPLYRIRTDWDPEAENYAPRLTPASVTRIAADLS